MGKDKGYRADVLILGVRIFKHPETFQHLEDVRMCKYADVRMCRFMRVIFLGRK